MASGYCYNSKNTETITSLRKYIKKKFVALWLPYVIWMVIFTVLHNIFININFYTNNNLITKFVSGKYIGVTEYWSYKDMIKSIAKALLLHGDAQLAGAFWFLATLLEIVILYGVIDYILKKYVQKKIYLVQTILSIIFLLVGYYCSVINITMFGLNMVFSYYLLYHIGVLMKKYKLYKKKTSIITHLISFGLSGIILFVCNRIGEISLGSNQYVSPIFLLLVSVVGWNFIYEMSFFIYKIKTLRTCMIFLGQNTMPIIIFHFIAFKLVSYLGVLFLHKEYFLVAAFPVLFENGIWWIAYTISGVVIPIILCCIWRKAKSIATQKK